MASFYERRFLNGTVQADWSCKTKSRDASVTPATLTVAANPDTPGTDISVLVHP